MSKASVPPPPESASPAELRAWLGAVWNALHPDTTTTSVPDRVFLTGMLLGMVMRLIEEREPKPRAKAKR